MAKQTIAQSLLIVLAYAATASAQAIVIRTGRPVNEVLSTPLVEGKLTFALPSGEKITIPIEFVDITMTRAVERVGVPTTTTPSNTTATQPNTGSTPLQRTQLREILMSPSAIETAINSGCQAQWATDFQMQAFCRKQQAEA